MAVASGIEVAAAVSPRHFSADARLLGRDGSVLSSYSPRYRSSTGHPRDGLRYIRNKDVSYKILEAERFLTFNNFFQVDLFNRPCVLLQF